MKISVIGAGNMGGAIARGLAADGKYEVCVSNPTESKLNAIKREYPQVKTTTDNAEAASSGDIIVLAVKPWIVESVISEIRPALDEQSQLLVSVAAGVTTARLAEMLGEKALPAYYVIPNTAISLRRSMTFIATRNGTVAQTEMVCEVFDRLGATLVVDEKQMPACMALASCGIAYAMRYVRANVEGAVELGLRPAEATRIVAETLAGAAELLKATGNNPEVEIDKVTTPGGITIRGLNELETRGFTAAVIAALRASV